RGSTTSTIEPAGLRTYFGAASDAIAVRTVFLETPSTRAIILIGNRSARCNLRISAQSSTDNTPVLPGSTASQSHPARGQNSDAAQGSGFTCRRQIERRGGYVELFWQ